MKWLFRKFFKWAMDDGSRPTPVDVSPRFHHASHGMQFTVIKADNGLIVQAYDFSKDMPMYWVVPEGTSVGQMIDTIMVERRLTR